MKVDIEKAIEMLKGHKKYVSDVLYESIDLAVETLENQMCAMITNLPMQMEIEE